MSAQKLDEIFDFVIVGSGGGSMCAALVMREAGKSVVILEKTDLVGGTTARSGGVMWIPNNRFMLRAGVEDSVERATDYLEATAGRSRDAPGSTYQRRQAYINEAPLMIEFLVAQGIKLRRAPSWPDYYDELPGSSVPGRTVVADIFDTNELGEWRDRLRPNFLAVPAYQAEGFEIATAKSSLRGKLAILKVGLRATLAKLTGKRLTQAGGALQGRMLLASLRAGVDIRVNSGVTKLLTEGNVVKGVVCEIDGQERHIAARSGVLINAGGFAQNQEMRDSYAPGTSVEWTAAAPGDTGEMLREMMSLGAAIGQMNERVGTQLSLPPGITNVNGEGVQLGRTSGQMNFAKPHSIVVDQSGVRYMNEGGSYMLFCQNMLNRNECVPAVPSWWIFDEQYIQKYMIGGTLPGTQKPDAWYQSGYLKRAQSLEELAAQIAVEPAMLRATVDRFNDAARAGVDREFRRGARAYDEWLGDHYHRPSNTLGPINKPPFYAAPIVPGDVGTYGGVITDEFARVLKEDGSVIEGLYATGVSTASVMGRRYPGAGSSIGPSFVFGYIAANHALQRNGK
jgi:3-oxosteroid 1-dehydrogenase